ncbi:hypothetical protein [Enterococcus hirae]|uniref:hypothetical protein n=1 Tax=Enterococcus hirae TaxID=1354 RepID=UPI001A9574D5|nr:hypothetical protein [Enterococcus hirae]
MKEYKRQHIIKHAIEMYIQREGASEKDINQEKSVLKEVEEDIARMKDKRDCGC